MPVAPYKFIEKRSSQGYVNNRLIKAATQNTDREQIAPLDNDVHKNVSWLGRRTLMTLGRWVYMVQDSGSGGTDFYTWRELQDLVQETQSFAPAAAAAVQPKSA